MNILKYKGYAAAIAFDAEDELFFGNIAGIADIVGFGPHSVGLMHSDEPALDAGGFYSKDNLVLEEGMVLSVEFYAGKKGKRDGVKLEEQILITSSGPVLLSNYPHDDRLLGTRL